MHWIVLYHKDGRLCEEPFASELDAEVFADVAGGGARVALVLHTAGEPRNLLHHPVVNAALVDVWSAA